MPWVPFTKRTEDPKLQWLKDQLDAAGIEWRCVKHSFHAPILEVQAHNLAAAARTILDPVDDIPDDDPRFC